MSMVLLDPFFRDPFIPNYRWVCRSWSFNWDPVHEFNLLLQTKNSECQPWEQHLGILELLPYDGRFGRIHPEELKVSLEGQELIVKGRHEQKDGKKSRPRFFVSHFMIPEGVDRYSVRCDLDEKGRLQIYGQNVVKDESKMWNIPIGGFEETSSYDFHEVPREKFISFDE